MSWLALSIVAVVGTIVGLSVRDQPRGLAESVEVSARPAPGRAPSERTARG